MAWAEKTFDKTIHEVEQVDKNAVDTGEQTRLRDVFRDMPPFIKITSGRARKTLARYEELKQRRIEKLRDNPVFKFVMMVAGLTNERMEQYWKGDSASPFSDRQMPMSTKLDKNDLQMLKERARERAFADLHQFCGPIKAVPMYRRAVKEPLRKVSAPPPTLTRQSSLGDDGGLEGYEDSESENEKKSQEAKVDFRSGVKYIYNMNDTEFFYFINRFQENGFPEQIQDPKKLVGEGDNIRSVTPEADIRWYILGRDVTGNIHPEDNGLNPFPAHEHFRGQDYNSGARTYGQQLYDDRTGLGEYPRIDRRQGGLPVDEGRPQNHSRDRIYDHNRIFGPNGQRDAYDHDDKYLSIQRSNWWQWAQNVPIVRWERPNTSSDKLRPEFWFQRYVARWLARDTNIQSDNNNPMRKTKVTEFEDLKLFKNRFRGLFNNLTFDKTSKAWVRDLTGLRLSKMLRRADEYDDGPDAEDWEGENDVYLPCKPACEVPLDFVRPLFNERYAHWKHELVLGEYEKRLMYQADQWLQKTPWAIGKIYLQPSIYAHMQEAHVAVCAKFKKFRHLELRDWISSEDHRYFFSKLVALCIRTSAVLSNKKYGLDKAYMRLNLEKRRIMHAISKLKAPQRVRTAVAFPRATMDQRRAWDRYEAARKANNTDAAASALRDMH